MRGVDEIIIVCKSIDTPISWRCFASQRSLKNDSQNERERESVLEKEKKKNIIRKSARERDGLRGMKE